MIRLALAFLTIALATALPGKAATYAGRYCDPIPAIEVVSARVSNSPSGGFLVEAASVVHGAHGFGELKVVLVDSETIVFDVEVCQVYSEWISPDMSRLVNASSTNHWPLRPQRVVVRASANSIVLGLPRERLRDQPGELGCTSGVCPSQPPNHSYCAANVRSWSEDGGGSRALERRWDDVATQHPNVVGPMLLELGSRLGRMESLLGGPAGDTNDVDVAVDCVFGGHRTRLE